MCHYGFNLIYVTTCCSIFLQFHQLAKRGRRHSRGEPQTVSEEKESTEGLRRWRPLVDGLLAPLVWRSLEGRALSAAALPGVWSSMNFLQNHLVACSLPGCPIQISSIPLAPPITGLQSPKPHPDTPLLSSRLFLVCLLNYQLNSIQEIFVCVAVPRPSEASSRLSFLSSRCHPCLDACLRRSSSCTSVSVSQWVFSLITDLCVSWEWGQQLPRCCP